MSILDLINYVGLCGYSVSYLACLWNKSESVEVLFRAGANFTIPDETGNPTGSQSCPRDIAAQAGHSQLTDLIDELILAKNKAAAEKGNKKKGKK